MKIKNKIKLKNKIKQKTKTFLIWYLYALNLEDLRCSLNYRLTIEQETFLLKLRWRQYK